MHVRTLLVMSLLALCALSACRDQPKENPVDASGASPDAMRAPPDAALPLPDGAPRPADAAPVLPDATPIAADAAAPSECVAGFAVEAVGDSGGTAAMAFDPDGVLNLAYWDVASRIRHAQRDATGWSITTVATVAGLPETALAIDTSGTIHIAYLGFSQPLAVASLAPGGAWEIEDLSVEVPGSSRAVDLVADGAGGLHLLAATPTAGVRYAHRTAGASSWTFETVDPTPSYAAAMALDSTGTPQIAFFGDGGVYHAARETGSWTLDVVPGAGPPYLNGRLAIAVTPDDVVFVGYNDHVGSMSGVPTVVVYERAVFATAWTWWYLADPHTANPTLATDSAGVTHLLYTLYEAEGSQVAYAAGGTIPVDLGWITSDAGAPATSYTDVTVAVDALDRVHATYTCDLALLYRRPCP